MTATSKAVVLRVAMVLARLGATRQVQYLQLRELLAQVRAADRATRYTALQNLGDYFEFADWSDAEITPVVAMLVAMAPDEADPDVLEQILDDLMKVFHGPQWSGRAPIFAAVSFDPIAELVVRPGFPEPLIEYGLVILASSRRQAYRPLLARFLTHPRQHVREAAREALAELDGGAVRL